MSLRPVGLQAARPTFRANQGGQTSVVPQSVPLTDLQTPQPQYMPAYKPGFIAKVRAFFARLTETVKGAVTGLCYGVATGGAAVAATSLLRLGGNAVKKSRIGMVALGASAIAGTLVGAFVGKKGVGESVKGAGVGLLYGAAAGIPAAVAAALTVAKNGSTAAKAVIITATAASTVAGAYVGKLISNGKVANIYMQHGAVNNLTGKK